MNRTSMYVAVAAAFAVLAVLPAQAQDKAPPAKGQAPAAAAPAAGATKELYPKVYFDFLLKERLAQGHPDTPELRVQMREFLEPADAFTNAPRTPEPLPG